MIRLNWWQLQLRLQNFPSLASYEPRQRYQVCLHFRYLMDGLFALTQHLCPLITENAVVGSKIVDTRMQSHPIRGGPERSVFLLRQGGWLASGPSFALVSRIETAWIVGATDAIRRSETKTRWLLFLLLRPRLFGWRII